MYLLFICLHNYISDDGDDADVIIFPIALETLGDDLKLRNGFPYGGLWIFILTRSLGKFAVSSMSKGDWNESVNLFSFSIAV